ncbi:carbon-nitrogen hydrolase family protein [Alphaproteobacteria bacterium]|jgi:deaminated glutathione amidase|nr:carbon-nitrogen hydrolase family protein [Alphaproteobacteria bacterium]MDC0394290.1 carbon-nitrogen hydrolase family protein [Alphaproteobacteria bacterium]MDC0461829.1 carbon-nitrogen hydrolase family protein [Alphaproteobacteria bacterium]
MLVAAAQYCASNNIEENQKIVDFLVSKASAEDAEFVCLPECANLIAKDKQELRYKAEPETHSPSLEKIRQLAKKFNITISIGSLMLKDANSDKILNRGYLITNDGAIQAYYDKIHMFDANVGDGKIYRESEDFNAGNKIVTCKTHIGHIGLSICYDIRFPKMYRKMAQSGAQIITSPAAFTAKTGKAHWHILQRARAIETGCFMIAAAQSGTHADGRQTYGHALIVNPWGKIIAEANTSKTHQLVLAKIDLNEVVTARNAIGAWKTD